MSVQSTEQASRKKSSFISLVDERPLTLFFVAFFISLAIGIIIFLALQTNHGFFTTLKTMGLEGKPLDAGGAGGFLQGAWGTAGSLAASLVAIILARQALLMTTKQDASQSETDERFERLQLEQNAILTRSTPEYAVSFAAAAASMRLDTLQIVIGTHERKKYRQSKPTISEIFAKYSSDDLENEVKVNIKTELLNSQLIKLAGEVAEKTRGPQAKLYLEALAAEIVLESRFSVDKILINEFTNLLRNVVNEAHKEILTHLTGANKNYLFNYQDYSKKSKSHGMDLSNSLQTHDNTLSESSYYFTYILEQQQRLSKYSYSESIHLTTLATNAIGNSKTPVYVNSEYFEPSKSTEPSVCFIAAFDFCRGKFLSRLELEKVPFSEPERGRPDLTVCSALKNHAQKSGFILLDQIEQHTDSIESKGKWITFQEHLRIWIAAKSIIDLIDSAPTTDLEDSPSELRQQLIFQQAITNFTRTHAIDSHDSAASDIGDFLPRFYEIENGAKIASPRNATNYQILFDEVAESLNFEIGAGSAVNIVNFFMVDFLIWLDQMRLEKSLTKQCVADFIKIIGTPENKSAVNLLNALGKRPYFERPFYGWYLPNIECPRCIFKDAGVRFIGIYYLTNMGDEYRFEPTPLFRWLSASQQDDADVNFVRLL